MQALKASLPEGESFDLYNYRFIVLKVSIELKDVASIGKGKFLRLCDCSFSLRSFQAKLKSKIAPFQLYIWEVYWKPGQQGKQS